MGHNHKYQIPNPQSPIPNPLILMNKITNILIDKLFNKNK